MFHVIESAEFDFGLPYVDGEPQLVPVATVLADGPSGAPREAMCAWLREHGIDPERMPAQPFYAHVKSRTICTLEFAGERGEDARLGWVEHVLDRDPAPIPDEVRNWRDHLVKAVA